MYAIRSYYEIVAREPHPRAREISAPVFIRIAVAGLRLDDIFSAVEAERTTIGGFHTLRVPEHLKRVQPLEKL